VSKIYQNFKYIVLLGDYILTFHSSVLILFIKMFKNSFTERFQEGLRLGLNKLNENRIKILRTKLGRDDIWKAENLEDVINELNFKTKVFTHVTRSDIGDGRISQLNSTEYARYFSLLDPEFSFNKRMKFKDLKKTDPEKVRGERCTICIEEYKDECDIMVLPCGHFLHRLCFFDYIQSYQINGIPDQRHVDDFPRPFTHAFKAVKCPLCLLSLTHHYLYYKERGLDPNVVRFVNEHVSHQNNRNSGINEGGIDGNNNQ